MSARRRPASRRRGAQALAAASRFGLSPGEAAETVGQVSAAARRLPDLMDARDAPKAPSR